MSTMTTAEEIRAHTRAMWAGVADSWAEHADYVETRGAHVAELMLARTAPQPGERVLELASGGGDVGIAAAPLVGPGEVVVSDVADEMVDIAARRAEARGLANVIPRVFGVEAIDDADSSYDVVLCREGLMFAFDPAGAAAQIARVLRPGGRVGIAVWGPPAANPWLSLVFRAASEVLGGPVPPPGMPGPFALADRDQLAGVLGAAGLVEVAVEEIAGTRRDTTFEQWWTRTTALAGPLAQRLAAMPDVVKDGLKEKLREAVRPYQSGEALEFPSLNLLATASRSR